MGGKPRIIPNQTYVLDPKDLEELEELTIDTVMREALESTETSDAESDERSTGQVDDEVPTQAADE